MKNSLFLWCCIFPALVLAQVHEDFSSDQYPGNLQWRGHTFAFGINADAQLQSQTINSTYISTENKLATGVRWEIGIRMGFNPSPANQLRIYLIADNDTLTAPLNGYFIQIGENGPADRYHLYLQEGENTRLLLSSPPIERADPANINDRIKVIRDAAGDWELQLGVDQGQLITAGTVRDTAVMHTSFFGFHCRFTDTNADQFYFDDFSIDTTAIDITGPLQPAENKLRPDQTDSAVFYDDFSAGLLSHWYGDTATFRVVSERLKLTEEAASPGFLAVSSGRLNNTVWETGIQVDGPLSAGNYVRLYLAMSDTLPDHHDGYHVQVDGAKGKHVYHIWQQRGDSRSRIFQSDSIPNRGDRFRARIRIIYGQSGRWQILADEYDSGIFAPITPKGTKVISTDLTFIDTAYAGYLAHFSKTRRADYVLDYLLIKPAGPVSDTIPDTTGSVPPTKPHAVIINELMANPKGAAGLPPLEYVELYNTTDETIVLDGWTFTSKTRSGVIPKGKITPHGYLLLCSVSDTAVFDPYGHTIGLTPWPSLVNTGTTLTLKDAYGTIVNQVIYDPSWYHDSKKGRGGWSLERISPLERCLAGDNWTASADERGGTPGTRNAVHDPAFNIDFKLLDVEVRNGRQLLLAYTQALDTTVAVSPDRYWLTHGIGSPKRVQVIGSRHVLLHYDRAFPAGREYTLTAADVANCAGLSADFSYVFFLPDTAATNDILINEMLFNPKSKAMEGVEMDGVDFVEIYNHSSKTVDLQQFYLAHVNKGKVTGHRQISESQLLFHPMEYKVLTSQPHTVQAHYPDADRRAFIQMASLPRFNNDSGTALLVSHGQTIDSLAYRASMHAPFIDNPKGISLERKQFDVATNAPGNFHSAATSVGGATPGYRNSQGMQMEGASGVYLTSKTFSPDGDGFEDILEINYHFPEPGIMASISIYDDKGRLVRRLQRNQSLATRGTVTWDGRSDTHRPLSMGIYIALIEVYNSEGMRKTIRRSFVLAKK